MGKSKFYPLQTSNEVTGIAVPLCGSTRKIEEFSKLITTGLGKADWNIKRNIICALVKRIEAGKDLINVVFRVGDTLPNPNSNPTDFLQHCARGSSR